MKRLDYNGLTTREIAKILGIPRSTVMCIERRALIKMRRAAEREGLRAIDLFDAPEREDET